MVRQQREGGHLKGTVCFDPPDGFFQNGTYAVVGQKGAAFVGDDCEEIAAAFDFHAAIIRHGPRLYAIVTRTQSSIQEDGGQSPPCGGMVGRRMVGTAHPTGGC